MITRKCLLVIDLNVEQKFLFIVFYLFFFFILSECIVRKHKTMLLIANRNN